MFEVDVGAKLIGRKRLPVAMRISKKQPEHLHNFGST